MVPFFSPVPSGQPLPLRPATSDDLPDLIELMSGMVPDCLPETVWQLPWTWKNYVLAIGSEGIAAAGSLQPAGSQRAEIRGLVVDPRHRGQGLASQVVGELVERAESSGMQAVCVTRKPGFFERLGFHETPTTWMRVERRLHSRPGPTPRVGMQRLPTEATA